MPGMKGNKDVQGLWWLTAAIAILVHTGKVYNTASMKMLYYDTVHAMILF